MFYAFVRTPTVRTLAILRAVRIKFSNGTESPHLNTNAVNEIMSEITFGKVHIETPLKAFLASLARILSEENILSIN